MEEEVGLVLFIIYTRKNEKYLKREKKRLKPIFSLFFLSKRILFYRTSDNFGICKLTFADILILLSFKENITY